MKRCPRCGGRGLSPEFDRDGGAGCVFCGFILWDRRVLATSMAFAEMREAHERNWQAAARRRHNTQSGKVMY